MSARSGWSITGSALAVLIGLGIQPSRPALGENLGEFLAVRSNALACIDQNAPDAKRIAGCTTVISMADSGVPSARTHIELIYVSRARLFQQEGKDQAAQEDFDTATRKDPRSELAWLALGCFYMAKPDYARALDSFNRGVKIGSKDAVAYNDRGAALTGLKRYDEALPDFARAIALDPRSTMALSNRATLYLASNRANLAIEDLNMVLRKDPFDPKALYNRGLAYERAQEYDRAVADLRSAVRIQPFVQAYEALGRVLARRDPQAALSELSEAIRLDPRSPALRSRAILYVSLGQYEAAVHDLDRAIAADSSDEIAYIDRGVAEEELGRLPLALADYSHSISLETTSAALVDRGSIYLRLGQRQKALDDFDAALALDPNEVAALIGRADVNYSPDERDPARLAGSLEDFSRVIAASPKNAGAYFVRGDIHFDLKDYAAAYSDFSESLELQPGQPAVLFNRALAAEHLGRSAEAAHDRQAARAFDASLRAGITTTREAAGSPTQIEYGAPANAPPEPRVVFATPVAAPEPPSPTAAPAPAPTSTQEVTITGYRRVVVNGQERFCKTEAATGTHIDSIRCYSKQQLAAQQERTQRYFEDLQRASGLALGGACEHSAVNSCIGGAMPAASP